MLVFCAFGSFAKAQLPIYTVTFSGDSILYQNAPFQFVEIIDARYDTSKLGLLKEGFDASSYKLIKLPETCEQYVLSYLNTVINESMTPTPVALVMKNFSVTEEPLGAIEIVKAHVQFSFYLTKNGQYKKIREVNTLIESPAKEVTDMLGKELELALRVCVSDFLNKPNTEGENEQWVSKASLLQQVMPETSLKVAPVGELDYAQRKFWLNGERISKKEAIKLLEDTGDEEIMTHVNRHKTHGVYSKVLTGAGLVIITYTLGSYIGTGEELNGLPLVFAMAGIIPGLIASKSRRHQMHLAVQLFNERYNR